MSLHLNFQADDMPTARAALVKHFFMLPFTLKGVQSVYVYKDRTKGEVEVYTYIASCESANFLKYGWFKRMIAKRAILRYAAQMAYTLDEDCIGVSFDGGLTGKLVGPRADKWPPFHPKYFKT